MTDAQIIAYNYGASFQREQATGIASTTIEVTRDLGLMSDAELSALKTMGIEDFHRWAQKGLLNGVA